MRDPPWVASEDPCSGKMVSFPASALPPARDTPLPVLAHKLSLKGEILDIKTCFGKVYLSQHLTDAGKTFADVWQ